MRKVSPVDRAVLNRIDALIAARPDLTADKVAKRLFGSGSQLKAIRNGERSLSGRTIESISDVLAGLEAGGPIDAPVQGGARTRSHSPERSEVAS